MTTGGHMTPAMRDRIMLLAGIRYRPDQPRIPSGRPGGGRFGSVIRGLLADASRLEDVEDVLAAEMKRITGRDIRVDLRGSDLQVAREHGEGILRGLERFPDVQLSEVTTYGPGGAIADPFDGAADSFAVTRAGRYSARNDAILFNARFAGGPQAYEVQLRASRVAGYSVGFTPTGVAMHEFGHVVSHADGNGGMSVTYAAQHGPGRTGETVQSTSRRVRDQISTYASTDADELAAEVFADVMINGDSASPLSTELFAVLQGQYDRRPQR